MTTCKDCGKMKPAEAFRPHRCHKHGKVYLYVRAECRSCENVRRRKALPREAANRLAYKRKQRALRNWWRIQGEGYGQAVNLNARGWRSRKPKRTSHREWAERLRRECPELYDPTLASTTLSYRARYRLNPLFRAKEIERRLARDLASGQGDGTLTPAAVGALFASAKNCAYCCKALTPREKTLDHVMPTSRGGMHSLANAVICCRSCNSKKHARTPEEWKSSNDNGLRVA